MEETIVVSKEITAGPQEVWDLITDLANMGRWSPENDGGKWLSKDGGPKLKGEAIGRGDFAVSFVDAIRHDSFLKEIRQQQ